MSATEVLKKLTTRNILALATGGTFLWAVVYVLTNLGVIADLVTTEPAAAGIGGLIVGAFLTIATKVYDFFFRKKPANE